MPSRCMGCNLLLPTISLAALLFSFEARADAEHCDYSGLPLEGAASAVQCVAELDGRSENLHFASVYYCLAFLFDALRSGREVDWPPHVSVGDCATAGATAELPLSEVRLELNNEGWPEVHLAESRRDVYGPWIVHSDNGIEGTYWPNFVCSASLEYAGRLAADSHGSVIHWDDALVQLAEIYAMLNGYSGSGQQGAEPQASATSSFPFILPGSDEDLK